MIEIDGDTHGVQLGYEASRTGYLEEQGFRVMRFTNAEVMGNNGGVLEAIGLALAGASPHPSPLLGVERGWKA